VKSETEVRDRLRALLVQELDNRIEEAGKRRPHLCVHNYRHPLDDRKTVDGEPNENYNRITSAPWEPVNRTLGLCMYGQESPENCRLDICEDDIDAQRCPLFQPTTTKASILDDLKAQLEMTGWIDENMPGAAELLWVLDASHSPPLPWWKELWYRWILRIRVETPRAAVNALDLLPVPELPPAGGGDEGVST
jgi:hypothetical protein